MFHACPNVQASSLVPAVERWLDCDSRSCSSSCGAVGDQHCYMYMHCHYTLVSAYCDTILVSLILKKTFCCQVCHLASLTSYLVTFIGSPALIHTLIFVCRFSLHISNAVKVKCTEQLTQRSILPSNYCSIQPHCPPGLSVKLWSKPTWPWPSLSNHQHQQPPLVSVTFDIGLGEQHKLNCRPQRGILKGIMGWMGKV